MKRQLPLWFMAFTFTLLSVVLAYVQKPTVTSFSHTCGITATAAAPASSTGDFGEINSVQRITATDVTMIKDIGSGYTPSAVSNGANVTYGSTITAIADLKATSATALTVNYTHSKE